MRSTDAPLPMRFDYQPVLRGDLVCLRPLVPSDFDSLYAVAADPLVWEQHPDKTRHQPVGFRAFFDQALASGGALLVTDTATDHVIGSSRFHAHDPERDEVEIGWTFLARSHWGGRYNKEMKRLMLRHAARFVSRVVFLVDPANLRSQRAMEKVGAIPAGRRLNGAGRESLVFAIATASYAEG